MEKAAIKVSKIDLFCDLKLGRLKTPDFPTIS